MTDIADLENRLSAALDRIAGGIDHLGASSGPVFTSTSISDDSEVAALRAALEEERTANAQLKERIKALTAVAEAREAGDDAGAAAASRIASPVSRWDGPRARSLLAISRDWSSGVRAES